MNLPVRALARPAALPTILTKSQTLRPNLDGMMSQLPFVLLVLFATPDGGHTVMDTTQRYDSATSCNVQALIENAQATDRVYVCVTSENLDIRNPATRNQAAQATPRN